MDTAAWKDEARKALDRLQSLRDEVRLQVHLAGMDAKDRWKELEPRVQTALDRAAREGAEGAKSALHDVSEELKKFRDTLVGHS